MSHAASIKFILSLILAITLLLLLVSPLGEGSINLKVYERKIKPRTNHRTANNAIVCNVTDQESNNFGHIGTRLSSNVVYRLNQSSAPSTVRSNLPTITTNSFSAWDTATNGITFTRGSNTSVTRARNDGQNIIAWNRLSSSTLGVTYIWYNSDTGAVVNVDTIMNSRHPWTWTNPSTTNPDQTCPTTNAYDAQNILIHEIGHWVGLDDLYDTADEDLTMYGYGSKQELKKDTLESGDISGAGTIYP